MSRTIPVMKTNMPILKMRTTCIIFLDTIILLEITQIGRAINVKSIKIPYVLV